MLKDMLWALVHGYHRESTSDGDLKEKFDQTLQRVSYRSCLSKGLRHISLLKKTFYSFELTFDSREPAAYVGQKT